MIMITSSLFSFELRFHDNRPITLVVEDKKYFRRIVSAVYEQIQGAEGPIILSDDFKPVELNGNSLLVFDPFSIEPNGRKVQSKISGEIKSLVKSEYGGRFSTIVQELNTLAYDLAQEISLPNTMYEEIDALEVSKLFRFYLEQPDEIMERVTEYCKAKVMSEKIKLIIFVNLHCFFDNNELSAIFTQLEYEHIQVLLLENSIQDSDKTDFEDFYIIDKDLCELYNEQIGFTTTQGFEV